MRLPCKIAISKLQLGDVIQVYDNGPFNTAVVTQVDVDGIHLARAYMITDDISYTNGVTPYLGMEQYSVPFNDREYMLWHRKAIQ